MSETGYPAKQGLYDPANEHDACGFGFVVDIAGRASHAIVQQALQVLVNLEHRGAAGAEKNTGDGAGILLQVPTRSCARRRGKLGIELPRAGRYAAGMVFLPPGAEPGRLREEARGDRPGRGAALPGLARRPVRRLARWVTWPRPASRSSARSSWARATASTT